MTKFFKRAKSSAKASASFSLSPQRGEGWGEGWEGSHSAADSHIFFLEICQEFGGHKNFVLHPELLFNCDCPHGLVGLVNSSSLQL
jgi:hypothetical protein